MKLNTPQKITAGFFVLLLVFWMWLFLTGAKEGFYNYLYSFLFGLPPLVGGLISIFVSKLWGRFQSNVGKAVFFLGLGLFLWGCGSMVWVFYYNLTLSIPAPYPSLADLGYAPGSFLYSLGAYYLAKLSETSVQLKKPGAKLYAVLATVVVAVISYFLFVIVARGGVLVSDGSSPIKTFFDIVYPLGDFTALTIAVLISGLSFPYMHGKYKFDIAMVLLGLLMMFIADLIFSYTTTVGSFYNGNLGDLFFTLSTSLLTFGVL